MTKRLIEEWLPITEPGLESVREQISIIILLILNQFHERN